MNVQTQILRHAQLTKLFLFPAVNRTAVSRPAINKTAVNLSFKIFGTGKEVDSEEPPIIICHGLLSTKKTWKSVGKTIERMTKRSVVTVDLRNHGKSPHSSSQQYEDQAADVLQLMKKLEVDRVTLIGHNMGARVAMCVALMEPTAVAGLLVVDMSPVSTCPKFKYFYSVLMEEMAKVKWKRKKVYAAQKDVKKQLKHIVMHDSVMRAVLSNVNVKPDGAVGWVCNLEVLIKQFKHIVSFPRSMKKMKYDGPTLFIGGQKSECIPADDLPGIVSMFPRAVVKFVPGAGHHVHADDPRVFLEHTIDFLRSYS